MTPMHPLTAADVVDAEAVVDVVAAVIVVAAAVAVDVDVMETVGGAKAAAETVHKARTKAAKVETAKAATRSAATTGTASDAVVAVVRAVSRVEANPKADHVQLR